MPETLFLKLGGSLITDKTRPETPRFDVLRDVARQIRNALDARPEMRLVLGHGSGSFGHVAAKKYGTRDGVVSAEQWRGFAEVSQAAARLNALVRDALLEAGVPVVSFAVHDSAEVADGNVQSIATAPIESALNSGLVPLVFGDVAFDSIRGGTILSTEEIMTALAPTLHPTWLLLAGETDGVYDLQKRTILQISAENLDTIRAALGGSRGADVTGGMLTKVTSMLALAHAHDGLNIRIFNGLFPDAIATVLTTPDAPLGTRLSA